MSLDRSVRGSLVLVLAAAVLTACGSLPYKTKIPKSVERQLKQNVNPDGTAKVGSPRALSFCYSETINTPQQVMEEAQLACEGGTVTLHDRDVFWTPCSVLQPRRATFICTPAQEAETGSAQSN